MKVIITLCALIAMFSVTSADASVKHESTEKEKITVGVSLFPPYVFEKPDKSLDGFGIELAEKILSDLDMDFQYNITNFPKKLEGVKTGKNDISIGGITVTERREKFLDFGTPTYNSDFLVASNRDGKKLSIIPTIIKKIFTLEMAQLLGILFGFCLLFGLLYWLAERGADIIKDKFSEGYPDAVWMTWMVKTTIGFGDYYPKKVMGRMLTIPNFFLGVIIVGSIQGPIVSAFTIRDIDIMQSQIQSLSDLTGKVIAIKGDVNLPFDDEKQTFAVRFCYSNLNVRIRIYENVDLAFNAVIKGDADAVIYDKPAILYWANDKYRDQVIVSNFSLRPHYYALAFPEDSELKEQFDQTLLRFYQDGTYNDIYNKWFGRN
jgi:polar amino acid transport system substrate-binding protein